MNDELEIYFEKETLNKSDSAAHFYLELVLTEKHAISSLTGSHRKHTKRKGNKINWSAVMSSRYISSLVISARIVRVPITGRVARVAFDN